MSQEQFVQDFTLDPDTTAIDALPIIPQRSDSGRGSSAAGTPSPRYDGREGEGQGQEYDNDDSDAGNKAKGSRPRKPHLQGRFSGRLETKQDEKRLAEECKLLGPLLGGTGKRGERSRLTLAKIVRGIASGEVRKFCLGRERKIQELVAQLEQLRGRAPLSAADTAGPSTLLKEESGSLPSFGVSALPSSAILQASLAIPAANKPDYGLPETTTPVPVAAAKALAAADGPGLTAVAQVVSMAMPSTSPSQGSEAQVLAHGAVQLKAQAQNFQAHAEQLVQQSKQAPSDSEAVQVAVQAQSFQAKAQSLEKAAEAQNLQAQAVVHAQAQAQAQAQAHHLVAQAHDHAQAYAQAYAQADHLKKVSSIGTPEIYEAHEVVAAQAQHLEHEAHSHAQAQTELTVQAHNLAAKAQAHAHAQAQAQAQAQQAAVEAHQLDAAAQQLHAEANIVSNSLPVLSSSPDKLPMLDHIITPRSNQGMQGGSAGTRGAPAVTHAGFSGLDIHPDGGRLPVPMALEGPHQGPIVSLSTSLPLRQAELQS